ncbi:MAG: helix-turn-helix transcriptional regulator [archaeon]|nr:helix-turn-helix transcriptional regulator [archaeon]
MNTELTNKLKKISVKNKTNSAEIARFRVANRKWLNYSSQIAARALSIIEDDKNVNQAALAEKLGKRPQQISKILKGQQNLTLKTISILSDVLGVELISFPPYKDTYTFLTNTASSGEVIVNKSPLSIAYIDQKVGSTLQLSEFKKSNNAHAFG